MTAHRPFQIAFATALLFALTTLVTATASAATSYYPLHTGNTVVYMGVTVKPGQSYHRMWFCYDGPAEDDDVWVDGSSPEANPYDVVVDDDYTIHLDKASGDSGSDTVVQVWLAGGDVSGDCAERSGYNWYQPALDGHWIDVSGGPGDDTLHYEHWGIYGDPQMFLLGDGGNDNLYMASDSYAVGGDGNDNIVGSSWSSHDNLWGSGGNDCLRDLGNGHDDYLCGTGTDVWNGYDSPGPGSHGCEAGGSGTPTCGWPF